MTSSPPLIVIFGAAIRRDGEPSAAPLRRIGYGLAAAREFPAAPILCSGGSIRPGLSEATVMAEKLQACGIAMERLIIDDVSVNTRQNCEAVVRWAGQGSHPVVIICSEAYHLPRIQMLLAFEGIKVRRGPVPAGPGAAPLGHWLLMNLREALAIPVYLTVFIVKGLGFRPPKSPTPGPG